ncbi:MAG: hypothetical protein GY850_33515 [bacterium]|nr:hypothetical protein [bacterium]
MSPAGKSKQIRNTVFLALMVVMLMPAWFSGQLDASPNLAGAVVGFTPQGWQIFDEVKQFTPETLYEQINGRASFFLTYDMIRLTYVSFVYGEEMSKFIDLSIYDMGTPTNAFGVFSGERSSGESPLDLGRAGYRSDANYFIWQGRYYIRIISSEASDELKRIGMDLTRKVTDFLPDSGAQVWGLTALPLTDRMPQSVQFFKVDAMGLDFMRNTYTAEYRKDITLVTAFLSQRDSPESARATVVKYTGYAEKYGQGIERLKAGEVELVFCDMGGSYDVVFHKRRLMGGVSGVEDRNLAIRAAIEMWHQLK